MIKIIRLEKSQKGQAMVELALILPVIVLILFGILEFGRIFYSYIVITYAAREGARAGAVGKTDAEIIARVREAAPLPEADTRLHIVKLEPGEADRMPGLPFTVEVAYDADLITPLFDSLLPDPVILKSRATMRIE
ncbi:TadE family protein [Thermoanaerobacterium sp. DL9XJH110]|uniref:TadE family protein n=1 Tax=Thermoanaerobacterium sp. DL9XJH110 TaxID=3386643 RepID=UPI003BB50EEA